MALKIIGRNDPVTVQTLICTIHSPPGIGKTSLGFTAKNPILLDFDNGAYRAENRLDSVPMEFWEDALSLDASTVKPFDTIVIDTVGRALDCLTQHIAQEDPKLYKGGQLSIQGYGRLKGGFASWMNHLRSLKKDIILLAHAEEKDRGEKVVDRLDVQGGSKGEIYKVSDMMGRLFMREDQRYLNFNPSDTSFGKNPVGLEVLQVPSYQDEPLFLGKLLDQVKGKINAQTKEQAEAAKFLIEWKIKCDTALTPEEFDLLMQDGKDAKGKVSPYVLSLMNKMLMDAASVAEVQFDAGKKKFRKAVTA